MGKTERLSIACARPEGEVRLEALLSLPPVKRAAPGVVACHPHPAGGGEMRVGLLETMERRMAASGLALLRFNFAGVCGSTGTFSDGAHEALDVAAAFDFLRSRPGVDPENVSVTGWSFGAWMALLAVAEGLAARKCVAISPPLGLQGYDEVASGLASSPVERHYIVGAEDPFCPPADMEAFTSAISGDDARNVTVLPSTGHFLHGREDIVAELVIEFVT